MNFSKFTIHQTNLLPDLTPEELERQKQAFRDLMQKRVFQFKATLEPVPAFVDQIYVLVEQKAWQEAAQKEMEALQIISEMWQIVQVVAEDEPYTYNDNNGMMECLYCNDFWGWGADVKHTKDHEPDCIVARARALVERNGK